MSEGVRVRFRCTCQGAPRVEVRAHAANELAPSARCSVCGRETVLQRERFTEGGGLLGCCACGHPELFTKKSVPPSVGILVVVVAAVLAPFTMYISLGVAALIDFALYAVVPDVVVCYVCGAEHRGFLGQPRHPRFDREIEERLKYGNRAVMGRPMREGGTANAPDPEH